MKQSFFSSVFELIARVLALGLVLIFFTIFWVARDGDFRLFNLVGYGVLISGGVILYELLAFVFFEIFSFVENKTLKQTGHNRIDQEPVSTQDSLLDDVS